MEDVKHVSVGHVNVFRFFFLRSGKSTNIGGIYIAHRFEVSRCRGQSSRWKMDVSRFDRSMRSEKYAHEV